MIQQIYPQVSHPYRYELNKDLQFAAAHYVPSDSAGQCASMHGHTYFANVTIAGDELDGSGFLVNFSEIKKLIHDRFDHSLLNEHAAWFGDDAPDRYPTTENVARTLCELVQAYLDGTPNKPRCVQIFLRETPTSYVVYRPGDGGARGV
ncbi:6-carboxytetrahydropterin synthase QueD [Cohnella sp. CFH 77786]|uniref:6-pyruvoyl trahydropterin synthase family protein n=1 Tax=Cohnella sp. CFH 77786 TaxID=2662265 RepID=UPI001C610EFA|nr:6-pyruvoyl tetrahydropterin synthase family protein [Cohnella sp. CFH 77786]MBW5446900.1 6-carboxytetrahydropterin synthase QueD [Cohnella sp. CFH 77786]